MEPFLGEVRLFAGTYAPAGWAFCDGTLLSISQNDALFALVGTTYGGDGMTTFGLPDLRGRTAIHQGTLSQYPDFAYTPGDSGGMETVSLALTEITEHAHSLVVTTVPGVTPTPAQHLIAMPPDDCKIFRETTASIPFVTAQVTVTGQGLPHANMQPFMAINYIIALDGIWPSQP